MKKQLQSTFEFKSGSIRCIRTAVLLALCFQGYIVQAQNLNWVDQMPKSGPTNYGNWGRSVAVDANYNVFTVGDFEGTVDFDPGPGVTSFSEGPAGGGKDIFISKLDSSGNFLWAKHIRGSGYNEGHEIAVDASGNCYITGMHDDTTDFDPGVGTANLIGFMDPFVAKYDPNGNLLWAKEFVGPYDDYGYSLTVADSGDVIVTGTFGSTIDFDPGAGVANMTASPNKGTFIVRLTPAGNFVWAKQFTCNLNVIATSIDTDPTGKIYLGGFFHGTADFDPGAATYNLTTVDSRFVVKLTNAGNFVWATNVEGDLSYPLTDYPAISVADDGSVYSAWQFTSTVDFDPGAGVTNLTSSGNTDAYVLKQDINGKFEWAAAFGKSSADAAVGVHADAAGFVYTTGYAKGIVDFDPGATTYNVTSTPTACFISVLDTAGTFVWAGNNTSTGTSLGFDICVDDLQKIYVTGHFWGAMDFEPGASITTLTGPGSLGEIFVQKLHTTPIPPGSGIENEGVLAMNIYPNPTTQMVTLDFVEPLNKEASVEIYNNVGQLIYKKNNFMGDNLLLDFENYSNGIYLVKVNTVDSENSWKVIKQ